jgi:hypothetical protein
MARTFALGLAVLFALTAARAADLPARAFKIESQPLSSALRRFAEQAQVQLIFSERDVSGLTSSEVAGQLAPRAPSSARAPRRSMTIRAPSSATAAPMAARSSCAPATRM